MRPYSLQNWRSAGPLSGFLMMGFGLICLLIAERRKKQSTKVDRGREPRPLVSRLLKNHFLWAIS
jgi:hypothetical protein